MARLQSARGRLNRPESLSGDEIRKLLTKTRAKGRHKPGVMNKTEAAYAMELEVRHRSGDIAWYAFEAVTLKLAFDTRYSPDFVVMRSDGQIECHEVKGRTKIGGKEAAYCMDDAKVKIKVAAEKFPFKFILVFPGVGGAWISREY